MRFGLRGNRLRLDRLWYLRRGRRLLSRGRALPASRKRNHEAILNLQDRFTGAKKGDDDAAAQKKAMADDRKDHPAREPLVHLFALDDQAVDRVDHFAAFS